jgi:3-hydroxyisobutyrate dehydrogenase
MRVGCIGLGELGLALAANLRSADFDVIGFRRGSLAKFEELGGHAAQSVAEVMARADLVLTCLPSADALEDVAFGSGGLVAAAGEGKILVDVTTAPVSLKERIRFALEETGASMLDCPISGRPTHVQQREATVFVSGDTAVVERARPVLEALSARCPYVGPFGSGSKLKFIANQLLIVHVLAAAEATEVARRAGIDPAMLLDILGQSPAASEQLRIRTLALRDGTAPTRPGAEQMIVKDLAVISTFIREVGAATPLFDAAYTLFLDALALGYGGRDSALIFTDALRNRAGS